MYSPIFLSFFLLFYCVLCYNVMGEKMRNENEVEYKIDFEIFTTVEIVKIMEFYHLVSVAFSKKKHNDALLDKYREYQAIINNKALEKKYDKMFASVHGFSIYSFMNSLKRH